MNADSKFFLKTYSIPTKRNHTHNKNLKIRTNFRLQIISSSEHCTIGAKADPCNRLE